MRTALRPTRYLFPLIFSGVPINGSSSPRLRLVRRTIWLRRQVADQTGGPTKTQASNRTIPLPQVVVDALAEHVATFPLGRDGLVFTLDGEPITRQLFGHVWRPAARVAGIPQGKGVHLLRHYYASLLIRYGESIKTVQARLGHATAAETLDTYSHLWPDSADRTREAIDEAFGNRVTPTAVPPDLTNLSASHPTLPEREAPPDESLRRSQERHRAHQQRPWGNGRPNPQGPAR